MLLDIFYCYANKISYADVPSLQQREQRIQKLRWTQKEALGAARIAALAHVQDGNQIRRQDARDEYDSDALQSEDRIRSDHSKDSFEDDHSLDSQDSVHSETSFEYGNLRESLLSDYEICLRRLEAMRAITEGALKQLGSANSARSTARAMQRILREFDETGQQTLLCLTNYIAKSSSHRKLIRKSGNDSQHESAGMEASSPLHSHEVRRSGTGKLVSASSPSLLLTASQRLTTIWMR